MTRVGNRPVLFDGNVLVALANDAHVHHAAARRWFLAEQSPYATCPITQGTLLRLLQIMGMVAQPSEAVTILRGFVEHPRHRFWPDDIDYLQVNWQGVMGHRQVTDAYLVSLAQKNGGRLATFDKGLAALHPGVAELLV